MSTDETTEQKILSAALDLFFRQGIKKTNLEEVAHRAGVTRVTVYRYFADKPQLVEAALMRIPGVLGQARERLAEDATPDAELFLDLIARHLAALPAGDFPALLDELQRVYPQVWQRVHDARLREIEAIFQRLFIVAEQQGRLRPGLERVVVQAYFLRAVVQVLEDPALVAQGFSAAEVFQNVKAIFLYGILKEGTS